MNRPLARWLPAVAWMAVIFALSHQPKVPGAALVPDWITHTSGYALLAIFVGRGVAGPGVAPLTAARGLAVFAFCTAYGLSDEWHQSFIPGRDSDPWDVVKDAVGSGLGVLAWPVGKRGAGGTDIGPAAMRSR